MSWPSDTALATAALVLMLLSIRLELRGIRQALEKKREER